MIPGPFFIGKGNTSGFGRRFVEGRIHGSCPRYFPRVQTPHFLGGLSYFETIFLPRRQGFIDGLLTIYGQR